MVVITGVVLDSIRLSLFLCMCMTDISMPMNCLISKFELAINNELLQLKTSHILAGCKIPSFCVSGPVSAESQ